jgi:hypothetical protein
MGFPYGKVVKRKDLRHCVDILIDYNLQVGGYQAGRVNFFWLVGE